MMNHRHKGGMGRHIHNHHGFCEMRGLGHPGGGGRRRGGRLFDYGELRLLVLALIADQPAHGYELIKTIEERFGGSYTPSPGVIYPTLAWLEDMNYAQVAPEAGGRKSYAITDEGKAFLTENQDAVTALLSRTGGEHGGHRSGNVQVRRAMENLKTALRLRLREGTIEQETIDEIAAAIDAAADRIGRL